MLTSVCGPEFALELEVVVLEALFSPSLHFHPNVSIFPGGTFHHSSTYHQVVTVFNDLSLHFKSVEEDKAGIRVVGYRIGALISRSCGAEVQGEVSVVFCVL